MFGVTTCWICKAEFTYRLSKNGRHRTYCSRRCCTEGTRRTGGRPVVDGRPVPRTFHKTRPCAACGESFEVKAQNHRWCMRCCPDKTARARLTRYGVSEPQWQTMVARYEGRCWICRENPADNLDHCHATGRPRGALCSGCNVALHVIEKPAWQARARAYLEEVVTDAATA
jgi:hypothetical protein